MKPNRRQILNALWTLPFAAAILQLLRMLTDFTLAGEKKAQPALIDLGPINELPEKLAAPLYHRRGRFWLLHNEDGMVAISNTCSHLECLFDWDPATSNFVCPCHGSRFDRHGRVLSGPATRDLNRYPLQLIGSEGDVLAATGEEPISLKLLPPEISDPSLPEGAQTQAKPQPHLIVTTKHALRSEKA